MKEPSAKQRRSIAWLVQRRSQEQQRSAVPRRHALVASIVLVPSVVCSACLDDNERTEDPNAIKIGALLPFTGDDATAGVPLEEAMIMATEQVNASGGVLKRPLALDERDTHGDPGRSLTAVQQVTSQTNLVALIGPDEASIAVSVRPQVTAANTVWLLPSTDGPNPTNLYFPPRTFLLAPLISPMTKALYDKMKSDRIVNPVIVNDLDNNNYVIGRDVRTYSDLDNLNYDYPISVQPGAATYAAVVPEIISKNPDAVVVLTAATTAATLVSELAISGMNQVGQVRWYLGPQLCTEVLVADVMPGALEGAVGVTYDCSLHGADFSNAFASRWYGDSPSFGAPYYYDATILVALALEAYSAHAGASLPSADELTEYIHMVAEPPGTAVRWNEVGHALDLVRRGEDIDYEGICNTLDFSNQGLSTDAPVGYWHISHNDIVF